MPLEIKMVLNDVSDYKKIVETLEHLFISEQSYCDYFFDFTCNALGEQKSVLRLRVPCVKPDSISSPLAAHPYNSSHLINTNATGAMAESGAVENASAMDPAYAAFLNSLSAPPMSGSSSTTHNGGGKSGPAVQLVPGACGKLVFKQKNTIDRGEQISFLLEEKEVPPEVVEKLLSGITPAFKVLEEYADTQRACGNTECKVPQLLESLRKVARDFVRDPRSPNDAAAELEAENYTQLRYASGGLSQSENTNSGSTANDKCSRSVEEMCNELGRMGNYVTTRKLYHFIHLAESERAKLTAAELGVRESLRIQIDRTLFPFGEGYELEVPRIDLQLDDIMQELKAFLQSCGIHYYLGSEGKFAQYMRMKRNADAETQDVQDVKMRISNFYGYQEVRNNLEQIVAERRKQRTDGRLPANADISVPLDGDDEETLFTEELHENYFFDSPAAELRSRRCFLRLRHYEQSKRYTLVLKQNQTIVDGQQENRSCKTELSEVSAQQLRENPTHFLETQWQHNAVTQSLWNFFNLRQLVQLPAIFRTYRITVPWWSAQSQRPTVQRNPHLSPQGNGANHNHTGETGVSPAHFLSQQQHSAVPLVPPLAIHLDRTQYELPPAAPTARQPFTVPTPTQQNVRVDHETGNRTVELYEMEITNIMPQTSPLAVLKELSGVLESLGVECSNGIQSKLEQYFSLL